MAKLKISGKDLRKIGYPESPVISLAMNIVNRHYKHDKQEKVFKILTSVLNDPSAYLADPVLSTIAVELIPKPAFDLTEVPLNETGIKFSVFGPEQIEEGAMHQMFTAAKLPVAVAGALMPDAHNGYGLPIGGVLATENAIIPYGVGVDIGCRMCLSVYDFEPGELQNRESFFQRELNEATLFGSGAQFIEANNHEVMENELFYQLPLLKSLHGKAWKQLGSSGSGNHFAEFGEVNIEKHDDILNIPAGKYVGLLTHSGSRGLGANIANHYTKRAIAKRRLNQDAKNLAWFTLDEEEGMEYWLAMNLAGDYASACHYIIHQKISKQLGRKPLRMVENHHNFAWKEMHEGREVIVHRKGATPAGKNILGIIPGSMTADGFIVKGKGEESSINSASHGAGRKMSRTKAIDTFTHKQFKEELEKFGVKLTGGGLDESPFAYKDIEQVMESQKSLVDIVGRFTPKIVKMDGAAKGYGKKKTR